jgi:UTP--glucose-1-phosphate uridylyltransferase
MSKITTAIIPVAGYGTRRLPITKAIEKCMLPIGNRPIVDYVVQDCIMAGITDIYFVVSEDSTQIREFYGHNEKLETYLKERGKTKVLEQIQPPENVSFHYIVQPAGSKYGTAIPVALASEFIGKDESVVVLMGDDIIYNVDGSSEVKRLVNTLEDGECGLLAARVNLKPGGTFGLIVQDADGYYREIVDQPTVEDNPPSDLINISKYVLNRDVIDIVLQLEPAYNGEYQLPEAINQYVANGGRVKVVPAKGEYLDGGNLAGWLHANKVICDDLQK